MALGRPGRTGMMVAPVVLALGGCGVDPAPAPPPRDPVIAAVLQEPLMTDPDLVALTQPGALFTLSGPPSAPIPLIDRGDAEVTAARTAAAARLGASARTAPDPLPAEAGVQPGRTLAETTARVLAELRGDPGCRAVLRATAAWGARLPEAVPIYPRGHLIDAAGADRPGCRLRAVTFLTPVPAHDAIDFYWSLAGMAGLTARHQQAGATARVIAGSAAGGFAAYVGERADGTAVTLITMAR